MNKHDEESGHSLQHFRSTSVPSLTTTPPPLEDVEAAGAERLSSNREGSTSWGGNDLWFGSEGAGKTGFKRPSLRVLIHSTPLPSHPTFSSSPTHLLPPILILTPASPPPDRNIPHSISSPSLTTLSFTGTNVSKRASTLPSSPSSSASSSSFYDQQQTALLTPAPYSPTSPSARRFKTSQHKSKKDSIDLELLPLHHGGDFHGRAYRGRGERAIERLSRVMALLMLLLAGIIVLRVLGTCGSRRCRSMGRGVETGPRQELSLRGEEEEERVGGRW